MHSRSLFLGLAAVGAALALAAPAKAVSLTSLLGTGNMIVVGNTVYSNFTYGGTTPASSVVVTESSTGLAFTTNTGGWNTPTGSSIISYNVTVTGSTITSVGLGFTATASGGAAAFVGETVTDTINKKDYSLQVFTDGSGPRPDSSTASVTLAPASTSLHVIKSIDVAAAGTGTASITLVDNTFTTNGGGQEPGIPEPMSLALLPLGIAGLALRKKLAR
jgi:hypothetical protein